MTKNEANLLNLEKQKNKTTSKNGVIIEEIETKVCKETIQLNKQNFFITWLTDERYQNSVVMSFLFVLENL